MQGKVAGRCRAEHPTQTPQCFSLHLPFIEIPIRMVTSCRFATNSLIIAPFARNVPRGHRPKCVVTTCIE